jgi:hypothetical protein
MKYKSHELLAFFDAILDRDAYEKASLLLQHDRSRIDESSPSEGTVGNTLPTLKARHENSLRSGKRIYGLVALIRALEELPWDTKILGYGVAAPRVAGAVYLLESSMKGLGVMLVDLSQ